MAVMHEHRDARAVDQPGQKGQAVLGVDDDVGSHAAQRPDADPRARHRQHRPDVDRVPTARTADVDAVDDFATRRSRIARGTQSDLDTGRGQLSADPLQVSFAATTLRVPGIAPAQQSTERSTGHSVSLVGPGL